MYGARFAGLGASPEYVGTNEGEVLGPHDVLRVTFAEESHALIPDDIAHEQLVAEVGNLISAMELGGYSLAPVSDVTVAPGALAVTIDFMPPGQGSITVGRALAELDGGLQASLTGFGNYGYIARVERISGAGAGSAGAGTARGAASQGIIGELEQTAFGAQLANVFGSVKSALLVTAVVGGVFYFGPEIKAALRVKRAREEHGAG